MLVLGIETSCDETAAAVVEDGVRVRSSVVASQHDLHEEYMGVVPEIASRAHVERLTPVVRGALARAGCSLDDLDAVAVGNRPGLIGSLLVGVAAAKALAWTLEKALVAVDHVHAHLYAGCLDAAPATFPALGLVVSGGHTALYFMRSAIDLERLGSTIDDALGEAYDKAATILGLPYPGGPALDGLAQEGGDERAIELPVSRLGPQSLDFSFSGLKTAVLYAAKGVPGGPPAPPLDASRKRDLAASFQRAASRTVILKVERALERVGECRTLLTGGGVTANSRLRRELEAFATARGLELRLPALGYCVDNAAMIAGLGTKLLEAGREADLSLGAMPTTSC